MVVEYDPARVTGLTDEEAARRLAAEGYNELPYALRRNTLSILLGVFHEPMFLLLVVLGTVYLLIGSRGDALLLFFFVIVIIGITFYQERKTERAIEALRDLSSPRALVVRSRRRQMIAGREVVRGDTVLLAEGNRVPADGYLRSSVNLSVDESLLSGESVPVRKNSTAQPLPMGRPGGDDRPFVYSGTLVVQGQGVACIMATGTRTEIGRIGRSLRHDERGQTVLRRQTQRLVRNLVVVAVILCGIVIVGYGLTRHDWLNGFLAGLTLAMAILPEEFPVVLTVFLALGAWRISKKNVLTRRVPAVEALGSATVLCVDKTGTLTLNRMRAESLFAGGRELRLHPEQRGPLPAAFCELVRFSVLSSEKTPFDPMEKALLELSDRVFPGTKCVPETWVLTQEYPRSGQLLAMTRAWRSPDSSDFVIAAKGAPEAIIDLCHLDKERSAALMERVGAMAQEGLRVIGVARAKYGGSPLPDGQHDFTFEFLGFVGFADQVRENVPAAVSECRDAGIRVVMITGDYPRTAQSIAGRIGLSNPEHVITGAELDTMDDEELKFRIRDTNIFARVMPEQKLRIVRALKRNGEVAAMTGDGVNDAPALKVADIGIAMGGRGTDVAREAAALVLLDDDFTSIVRTVRLGRRIFDNLRKAMSYILAIHVPIAGMTLIPVLMQWPLVLLPVHIVFLELIIDPACSIAFEAEPDEIGIMKRPPASLRKPLFGKGAVLVSALQGLSVLLIVLAVYVAAVQLGRGITEARTLAFTTLIIANVSLILSNRSWSLSFIASLRRPNRALWVVIAGALFFLALVLYVPVLRELFHFSRLHADDLLFCLAAAIVSILWFEVLKRVHRRKNPSEDIDTLLGIR